MQALTKSLSVVPADMQVVSNGVLFDVTHKLSKSIERDSAPHDQILTIIQDDAGMTVDVAITTSAKSARQFVAKKLVAGLTRHPDSFDILARRSQLSLF